MSIIMKESSIGKAVTLRKLPIVDKSVVLTGMSVSNHVIITFNLSARVFQHAYCMTEPDEDCMNAPDWCYKCERYRERLNLETLDL